MVFFPPFLGFVAGGGKKTAPDHLSSLECLDVPTTVDDFMREMEDAGEETLTQVLTTFC